jgi:penicillin-binding protein 1C
MALRFLKKKNILGITKILAIGFFLLALACLTAYRTARPPELTVPVSPRVLSRQGEILFSRLSQEDQWLWPARLDEMGPYLPRVAVAVEDKRFFRHRGLDPLAVIRAAGQNIKAGRVVSGGSTITVQVVKLLSPAKRTLITKFREFFQAVKLDRNYSKEDVLEFYLNIAPMGGNIKGVGAASWAYFKKKPADLSLGESVTLIAVLRGPAVYRPDRHPDRAKKRRDLLLERLYTKGVITEKEKNAALSEPITARRYSLPDRAPHFSRLILKNYPRLWTWGSKDYTGLKTTVDSAVQAKLEMRLSQALARFTPEITGAGAVVSNSGEIIAYVGNARPGGPYGYIDCVWAKRSPGSSLKPFIYLAAMEEGLITPAKMLADTPIGLDGQAPRNFDGQYRGPVSAGTALAESLNVPAVRVLRALGTDRALLALDKIGLTFDRQKHYGDSLVLGGLETSLWQLLGAYSALADQGRRVKFKFLAEEDSNPSVRDEIFSPQAAWLITQALAEQGRLPRGLQEDNLAFKTGTSHGFRDAWFSFYRPDFTAVLWLGHPAGAGTPNLSGLAALAEPAVLFARSLGRPASFPPPPPGLSRYKACPLSGEPAGPYCPDSRWAYRLTSQTKTHPCTLHIRQNGRTVIQWPKELAGFMASRANREGGLKPAAIVSPLPGGVIRLDRPDEALPLKSEGTTGPVYWYVDGEFLAVSRPGQTPLWPLKEGAHRVTLVDLRNRTAKNEFLVIKPQSRPDIPVLSLGREY